MDVPSCCVFTGQLYNSSVLLRCECIGSPDVTTTKCMSSWTFSLASSYVPFVFARGALLLVRLSGAYPYRYIVGSFISCTSWRLKCEILQRGAAAEILRRQPGGGDFQEHRLWEFGFPGASIFFDKSSWPRVPCETVLVWEHFLQRHDVLVLDSVLV